MVGLQHWLDIEANNLANANTTGYKADSLTFQDSLEQKMYANGGTGQALGSLGSGPTPGMEYTNFATGSIKSTGNPLDVAITNPTAMFVVKTPNGLRYTRDGEFTLAPDSTLVSQAGYPILDDSGRTITLPTGTPEITSSGQVIVHSSKGVQTVAQLGIATGRWQKEGSNLFQGQNVTPAKDITLATHSIEGSNVNAVKAMTDLIKIQRTYDLAQKSITTSDKSNQLLIQALNA